MGRTDIPSRVPLYVHQKGPVCTHVKLELFACEIAYVKAEPLHAVQESFQVRSFSRTGIRIYLASTVRYTCDGYYVKFSHTVQHVAVQDE